MEITYSLLPIYMVGSGILRHLLAVSNFEFSTENRPDNLGPHSRS